MAEVSVELQERVTVALDAGICPWRIVVDPGIGFAKKYEHNVALLRNLAQFKRNLGNLPVLIGASRKRFLGDPRGRGRRFEEGRGDGRRLRRLRPRTPTSSASATSARPSGALKVADAYL